MRIAVPDLVSPSYFPAIAAVQLGLVDAELELLYPVTDAADALRDGRIDVLAGAAHAMPHAFPNWTGVRLVTALSRNTYWFLVVRSDLGVAHGDLAALRDVRIAAAPGPDAALWQMLADADVDVEERRIEIVPVPSTDGGISFGVSAAEALAAGGVDGFWANGMGAEVAVRAGTGSVVVDARRGDGPPGTAAYTFPAVAVTEQTIATRYADVDAVVRGIAEAQRQLREDPERATAVGEQLFPPMEASLIAELVRRDAPYYDPGIDAQTVDALVAFGRRRGDLTADVSYGDVVSAELAAPSR